MGIVRAFSLTTINNSVALDWYHSTVTLAALSSLDTGSLWCHRFWEETMEQYIIHWKSQSTLAEKKSFVPRKMHESSLNLPPIISSPCLHYKKNLHKTIFAWNRLSSNQLNLFYYFCLNLDWNFYYLYCLVYKLVSCLVALVNI